MPGLTVPNFIVHYSRSEPFRSITSAPHDQRQMIIEKLNSANAWGLNRFTDLSYLQERVQAETKLRSALIAKGGKPELEQPIYFFLGRNKRFEEQKLNKGYKINLSHLLSKPLSFTYGDSMLALIEENRTQSGIRYNNPLCKNVYRLDELAELYSRVHFSEVPSLAIEAQLWIMPSKDSIEILTD